MKIEIWNLDGTAVRTIELDDGEYRISIMHSKQVPLQQDTKPSAPTTRPWLSSLALTGMVLAVSAFQYLYLNPFDRSGWDFLRYVLNIGSFVLFLAAMLSVVCKMVVKRFRPGQSFNFALLGYSLFMLHDSDFFGLRWSLPRLFWYSQGYDLLFYLWVGILSWYLSGLLLHCFRASTRAFVLGLIALSFFSYKLINYLPVREKYSYFESNTSPPRVEWLETNPITVDELLARIGSEKQ